MRVLREPRRTDAIADEHDGGAARPIIRRAVLAIAGRVEDAHADSLQPVGRDDGTYVRAETELVYVRPDIAPLLLFGGIAAGHEVGEGAECDHVGREDW